MQLVDDRGQALDAEYTIESDGSYLALIMASRSGASGTRPLRNPDYNRALTILLERLAQLDAGLVDALVESRRTQQLGLPESDRRLIAAPIRLAQVPDLESLRRSMGTAQAKIAQAPDATKGGNSTKRIRLRLEVPGYRPGDAARLEGVLAVPMAAAVPTFILAWHPLHFLWQEHDYDQAIQVTAAGQTWHDAWTVGVRTGGINAGDRAVLYRQYQDRGVVASGIFTSGVYIGPQLGRQRAPGQVCATRLGHRAGL